MKRLLIIGSFMLPFLAEAGIERVGYNYRYLSLFYGQSYRFENVRYHSFEIANEWITSTCTQKPLYRGFGVKYDHFSGDNFAAGVRFFRSLPLNVGMICVPYIAAAPTVFYIKENAGMNIKPEVGLRIRPLTFTRWDPVNLVLNVSYGYDLPVVNRNDFTLARHDLSVRLALTINIKSLKYYMKKKPQEAEPILPD